jgi:phage terminase large subunit-like protein
MRIDPNPFPQNGTQPLYCSSLHAGTTERRWEFFDSVGADFDGDCDPKPGQKRCKNCAECAVRWFAGLKHTQGPLAGKRFDLSVDQDWLIREAFGWKRPDGLRLFRIIFVEMGRGNGKSQLGAGVAGKLLLGDNEIDPEIVGVAATRPMARKYCFNRLKAMIAAQPQISAKVDMYRHEIRRKEGNGVYEATSADVTSAWGGAPHGIVFDEVHAQPNRELWDALETSMGKRAQPMMWGFTTAGWDKTSLCFELHEHTRQLAESSIEDVEFLGVIWAADEDEDWTDPDVWRKANPMMGLAFEEAFIASKCAKALSTPAFQNTFRTMYLSQWVGQEVRYLDMMAWDKCNGEMAAPTKREAYGGLDLSSTTDLSAFVTVSRDPQNPDIVDVYLKLYAPAEGLHERERRDRMPYGVWVREGILTLTPGPVIDQDYIKRDILAAKEVWKLRDVSYDRWNASKLVKELENEGVIMAQMGQGYAGMSAATKELLKLVTETKLRHGGNPALRAQANATMAVTDAAENIKPDKSKSSARIDGVVGTIMALDGLTRRGRYRRESVWDRRAREAKERNA